MMPPLVSMLAAMRLQENALDNVPNLTTLSADIGALDASLASWSATRITEGLLAVQTSISQLKVVDPDRLIPDLQLAREASAG